MMSLSHVPTPDYGLDDPEEDHGINTRVHTVDLEPDPDEWDETDLREIAKQPRYPDDDVDGWPGVNVIPVEESPFPYREKIPAKDEIVQERGCTACGNMYREYIPDPQTECPHCGTDIGTSREPDHDNE